MGFKILGATESIRKAINLMILVVKHMDNIRARKIISSHLVTAESKSDDKKSADDSKKAAM